MERDRMRPAADRVAKVMRALSNTRRMLLLAWLSMERAPISSTTIEKELRLPASTVATDLKVLAQAGLVRRVRRDREVLTSIDTDQAGRVASYFAKMAGLRIGRVQPTERSLK